MTRRIRQLLSEYRERLQRNPHLWRYVFGLGTILALLICLEIYAAIEVGFRPRGAIVAAVVVLAFGVLGMSATFWLIDRNKRKK